MRGLLLISVLIALAYVGYLQTKSANTAIETDPVTGKNKMEQVEQDVNAALESHMQNLQAQPEQ
jgi:hypothetical protein